MYKDNLSSFPSFFNFLTCCLLKTTIINLFPNFYNTIIRGCDNKILWCVTHVYIINYVFMTRRRGFRISCRNIICWTWLCCTGFFNDFSAINKSGSEKKKYIYTSILSVCICFYLFLYSKNFQVRYSANDKRLSYKIIDPPSIITEEKKIQLTLLEIIIFLFKFHLHLYFHIYC